MIFSKAGERQKAFPDTRFARMTILSFVRRDGTAVPLVFEGALNREIFLACIRQFPAPSLKPGDIVVMDNLSSHKAAAVREALEGAGASILCLPPYNPDSIPIELIVLRKLKIRAAELLPDAIAEVFDSVSASDIAGWFQA